MSVGNVGGTLEVGTCGAEVTPLQMHIASVEGSPRERKRIVLVQQAYGVVEGRKRNVHPASAHQQETSLGCDQPNDRRRQVGISSLIKEFETFIDVTTLSLLIAQAEQDSCPGDDVLSSLKRKPQILPGLGMTAALARAKGSRMQLLGR
ncbi:MAG: hypothetical protein ACRDO1_13420 [Nocardioidaceae bacterium]